MTKTSIENLLPPAAANTNASAIRLGGVFRLPPVTPVLTETDTADLGRIRLGGVFRLPPVTPVLTETDTADLGRIRLGGVFRLAA